MTAGDGPMPAVGRTPGARPVEPRSQHGLRSDAVAGSGGGGVGAVCQPDPFVAGLARVLERHGHRLGAWDKRAGVRVCILAPDTPIAYGYSSSHQVAYLGNCDASVDSECSRWYLTP